MTDKILTADDVRALLRRACDLNGGQSKWAHATGVFPAVCLRCPIGAPTPRAGVVCGVGDRRNAPHLETC